MGDYLSTAIVLCLGLSVHSVCAHCPLRGITSRTNPSNTEFLILKYQCESLWLQRMTCWQWLWHPCQFRSSLHSVCGSYLRTFTGILLCTCVSYMLFLAQSMIHSMANTPCTLWHSIWKSQQLACYSHTIYRVVIKRFPQPSEVQRRELKKHHST